ncbi:MAG: hypothetical protein MR419_06860 [Clostridiales bacterium]|nr:hypothetical protein [Clostridiales bacterium]MDY4171900.1 hypothetical protein [Evtepia sp.]
MRLYQGVDFFLFFEDFPCMGVPGFIGANADGTSSIYINTLYCEKKQNETLRHELRHLALGHLWRDDMELPDKEWEAEQFWAPDVRIADDFSYVELTNSHTTQCG